MVICGMGSRHFAQHPTPKEMFYWHITSRKWRVEPKENDLNFVQGKTKHGYLNSLMRGMHMYEHQHKLTQEYGDWTWTKSKFYELTKAMLKKQLLNVSLQFLPQN